MFDLSKDILPIFKKHTLTFHSSIHEKGDIYTFIFKMEDNLTWQPGQHGLFRLDGLKLKESMRIFSVASIPSEGHIKISTKISEDPSDFKRKLKSLKVGSNVTMRGPVGNFYPKEPKPLVFIALGIGITPYRALIKQFLTEENQKATQIELLYLEKDELFIYDQTFSQSNGNERFNVVYLTKKEALYTEIDKHIMNEKLEADYYLVGPKSMIKTTEEYLKNKGVKGKNIKKDTFIGY